jgi:hypothetical protein
VAFLAAAVVMVGVVALYCGRCRERVVIVVVMLSLGGIVASSGDPVSAATNCPSAPTSDLRTTTEPATTNTSAAELPTTTEPTTTGLSTTSTTSATSATSTTIPTTTTTSTTTTVPLRAPLAVGDSYMIESDSCPSSFSGNVLANDDSGNPSATLTGPSPGVPSPLPPHQPNFVILTMQPDGSFVLSWTQSITLPLDVEYLIENAVGSSIGTARFEIEVTC